MPKTCVNHKEVPSATMCHQCHAPICTACSIVTPQGTFCSPECGILFREFKTRQNEAKEDKAYSKMTLLIKLVAAFLFMGLGFVGINQAAEHGVPQLRSIDVIGRILNLLKPH